MATDMNSGANATMANAFASHDHRGCIAGAVRAVEAICADRGLRLTAPRRRVLEILLEQHRALGAYDVLARIAAEGARAHPPVAYRALEFLVAHGFAHRIEGINAFVACPCPQRRHRPAFMICRTCRAVAEADAPEAAVLGSSADRIGFLIERTTVEAEGLCPACAAAAP